MMVAVATAVAHAMIALITAITVATTALAVVMTDSVAATAMTVVCVTTVAHVWAMPPSAHNAMPWTTPKPPCASWPAKPMARR